MKDTRREPLRPQNEFKTCKERSQRRYGRAVGADEIETNTPVHGTRAALVLSIGGNAMANQNCYT